METIFEQIRDERALGGRSTTEQVQRGLIVKKVWLDKIFDDGKVWEMRSARTNITGRIGLIESGTGLIVGEAELTGCSERPVPKQKDLIKYHKVEDMNLLDKWKWAWFISKAKRYDKPIHYKHPKGAVIWVNLQNNQTHQDRLIEACKDFIKQQNL